MRGAFARCAVEESRQPKIVCRGDGTASEGSERSSLAFCMPRGVVRDGAGKGFVTAQVLQVPPA